MNTIKTPQAVDRLASAVRNAGHDDLVEIYNELFPQSPTTEEAAVKNPSALVDEIISHINGGLELEEILDLWNVVFPSRHGVWSDEEDGLIHYQDKAQPVGQTD